MNRIVISALILFIVVAGVPGASALPSYLDNFNTTYPFVVGTRIDTCILCHVNPSGGGSLNVYGRDFSNNTHNFTAIESIDSDADGFTNFDEIVILTFPGNSSDYPFSTTSTATGTITPTATGTITPTATGTITPTATGTITPTATGTITPTATGTLTTTVNRAPTVPGTTTGTAVVTGKVTQTVTASTPVSTIGTTPGAQTPGFEILFAIAAVLSALLVRRR